MLFLQFACECSGCSPIAVDRIMYISENEGAPNQFPKQGGWCRRQRSPSERNCRKEVRTRRDEAFRDLPGRGCAEKLILVWRLVGLDVAPHSTSVSDCFGFIHPTIHKHLTRSKNDRVHRPIKEERNELRMYLLCIMYPSVPLAYHTRTSQDLQSTKQAGSHYRHFVRRQHHIHKH